MSTGTRVQILEKCNIQIIVGFRQLEFYRHISYNITNSSCLDYWHPIRMIILYLEPEDILPMNEQALSKKCSADQ
jgi:hypothetical protein